MNTKIAVWRIFGSLVVVAIVLTSGAPLAHAADPDYSAWQTLLTKYYDPARGMDYAALKAKDTATLNALRQRMAAVNVASLTPQEQLAYWINLYNISTIGVIIDNYPTKSIRDISTDPIIRLNVFKKPYVKFGNGSMSLNDVENVKIRDGFKDARIHFAINCAAASCPPIRPEPYVGSKLSAQLDDQTRKFLNGPKGVRLEQKGSNLTIHTTKIMDWFGEDFDKWGGGKVAFIRKYVTPDKQQMIDQVQGKARISYQDYSWALNDWKR
ncbi:MAG TPA: DUF547 domain-containing protein [Thermoanaerobaculia bacterium]|nr:DUF547 domain-containing protein [Thermoanaerobaculia bacterium]